MFVIPAIYKNNVKYGGGSSSSNIDITTTLTEDTVSDTSVPSSKAVYSIVDNLQTELNNVIDDNNKINNNLKWKVVDIDLYVAVDEWSNATIETGIKSASEFYLVGSGTYNTSPILPVNETVNISNGLGISDGYHWSGHVFLSSAGVLQIVTSRISEGTKTDGYLPHFIKLYYR